MRPREEERAAFLPVPALYAGESDTTLPRLAEEALFAGAAFFTEAFFAEAFFAEVAFFTLLRAVFLTLLRAVFLTALFLLEEARFVVLLVATFLAVLRLAAAFFTVRRIAVFALATTFLTRLVVFLAFRRLVGMAFLLFPVFF